jgi:histone H3/H4
MNPFLITTILAASSGDREDTIWMQILVLVILAALWGMYTFIKNKPANPKGDKQKFEGTGSDYAKSSWQSLHRRKNISRSKDDAHRKYPAEIKGVDTHSEKTPKSGVVSFSKSSVSGRGGRGKKMRDVSGGMELLDLDLLLHIVHSTQSDDKDDVTMRKLAFNELLRRQGQDRIYSDALSVYAVDKSKLYGKDIQCEAIKELTQRTARSK